MPVVAMPDGVNVQFPDDMPPEQIASLIAQKHRQVATQALTLGQGQPDQAPSDTYEQAQSDIGNKVPFWQGAANSIGIPAFRAGITRIPLGIMQAESEGLSKAANSVGLPDTANALSNTANLMSNEATTESVNAEANKVANPVMGTAMNILPQIGQVAGFGTSLPGVVGAGFTMGAAAPKLSADQQAQIQPANTIADQAMNALGYLPKVAVNAASNAAGIDPNSRFAQGIQGGLTGVEGFGIAKAIPKVIDAVTPEPAGANLTDIGNLKNAAYAKADASGQVFSPDDLGNKFASDVNNAASKPLSNGQLTDGDAYLNNILKSYAGFEDKPIGITEADKIDKNLSGDIQRAYKAGYNYEGGKLADIQDNFRNQLGQAPAGEDLNQARGLAAAEFKMRDLQAIKDTANTQGEIKTGLKNLYKRIQKNPQGWMDDEISAIQDGSKTGLLTGALQTVGGKLTSGVAGAVGGAIGGGIPGALIGAGIGEGVGFPMRLAAKAIQSGKLNKVMDMVGNRPVVQDAFNAPDLAPMPAAQAAQIMGMRARVNRINQGNTQ